MNKTLQGSDISVIVRQAGRSIVRTAGEEAFRSEGSAKMRELENASKAGLSFLRQLASGNSQISSV